MLNTQVLTIPFIAFGLASIRAFNLWSSEMLAIILLIALLAFVVYLLYRRSRADAYHPLNDKDAPEVVEEGFWDATFCLCKSAYISVRDMFGSSNPNSIDTNAVPHTMDYVSDNTMPNADINIGDTVTGTFDNIDTSTADWDVSVSDSVDIGSSIDFDTSSWGD